MKPPVRGRIQPPTGLLRRVDAIMRGAFPTMATLVLMIAGAVPVGAPGLVMALCLPCVFFWTVFRPAAMPPPAVFGLGVAQDLLAHAPFASGVLVLLAAHGAALRLRGFVARQRFGTVWMIYCGVAAGAAALAWALQGLLDWRLPPTSPGLHQAAISIGIYPCLAWLLSRAHRALAESEA